MTFIIDMASGETLVKDKPRTKHTTANIDDTASTDVPLVMPALQTFHSEEPQTETTASIANIHIADLLEKLE